METAQRMNGANPTAPLLLRPMGMGELLDLAISLYRRNWTTLVGISAVVGLPLLVLQVTVSFLGLPLDLPLLGRTPGTLGNPNGLLLFYAATVLIALIGAIANIFQAGATAAAVSERYLGRPITIKQAFGRSLRHWLPLLVASLLLGLIGLALLAPFLGFLGVGVFAPLMATQPQTSAALAGIVSLCLCAGAIPLFPFWLYIVTRLTFYTQAIVIEDYGGRSGLGRSWRLVKNSFWRVLATIALLWLLIYILTVVPALTLQTGIAVLIPGSVLVASIVSNAITATMTVLVTPIQNTAITLLYYDLRIRKEGYDLQLAMEQTGPRVPVPLAAGGV